MLDVSPPCTADPASQDSSKVSQSTLESPLSSPHYKPLYLLKCSLVNHLHQCPLCLITGKGPGEKKCENQQQGMCSLQPPVSSRLRKATMPKIQTKWWLRSRKATSKTCSVLSKRKFKSTIGPLCSAIEKLEVPASSSETSTPSTSRECVPSGSREEVNQQEQEEDSEQGSEEGLCSDSEDDPASEGNLFPSEDTVF